MFIKAGIFFNKHCLLQEADLKRIWL